MPRGAADDGEIEHLGGEDEGGHYAHQGHMLFRQFFPCLPQPKADAARRYGIGGGNGRDVQKTIRDVHLGPHSLVLMQLVVFAINCNNKRIKNHLRHLAQRPKMARWLMLALNPYSLSRVRFKDKNGDSAVSMVLPHCSQIRWWWWPFSAG